MNSKSRIGRRKHHPRMKRECRHCQCRLSGRPACGRPSFERSLRSLVRLLLPLPRLLLSPPRPRPCSRGRGHGHTRGPPLSPLRLLQRSLAFQNRGRRHRSSALDHALPRQSVSQFRQCTARGEMPGKARRMGCLAISDWPHRRGPRRPHPLRPQSPRQHQSQPGLPRLHWRLPPVRHRHRSSRPVLWRRKPPLDRSCHQAEAPYQSLLCRRGCCGKKICRAPLTEKRLRPLHLQNSPPTVVVDCRLQGRRLLWRRRRSPKTDCLAKRFWKIPWASRR
mmetsp:Transcript_151807/g.487122  ORF Transcript_151807/g.487122 Transcript_151807/m.487122 type:complete len:278 (-) Transcript_151807:2065-2898(-)